MDIFTISLVSLIITSSVYYLYKKNTEEQVSKKARELKHEQLKDEGKEFVEALEKLDYFKYTSPANLSKVKDEIIEYYDPEYTFTTYWEDEEGEISLDYRAIHVDCEKLLEQNGIPDLLKGLQPAFQKFGLLFSLEDHHLSHDKINGIINEYLIVNGVRHCIFENEEGGFPTITAPAKIAEIINQELEQQQLEERTYIASSSIYLLFLFITPEQQLIFDKAYTEPDEIPRLPEDWKEFQYLDS